MTSKVGQAKKGKGTQASSRKEPPADVEERKGTREEIVRVATGLFLQRGYDGTSVKAIATQVGITTPGLYWHFPSKQDIFFAALEQALNDFLAAVREQITAESPRERLSQYVRAHTVYQLERVSDVEVYQTAFGMRALIARLPASYQKRIIATERGYLREFQAILEAGRSNGDFDFEDLIVTTFAVIELCEFSNSWFNPDGRLSPAEVGDLYVSFALKMVGAAG